MGWKFFGRLKSCGCLLAVLFALALSSPARAVDYYVDALNGSDSNNSLTALTPSKTINGASGVKADGFGSAAGDTLYISGTFREQLRLNNAAGNALDGITIKQWPGKPQAVLRGDTARTLASGWTFIASGVFDTTIAAGTTAWWNNAGTHYTLTEGICDVVLDWDVSIDSNGRHYGHLAKATSAANSSATASSWFFTPATPAGSGGGGGTLRVNFGTALADTAALATYGATHTLAFVLGNLDGIEIGTPTYTTYPTWGSYSGVNVNNLLIDGLHIYLWADSGYRKNKATSSGVGEDGSAYGAGLSMGVVSIGYGIRVADGNGCTIQNCTFIDNGYHPWMFVGDRCTNNIARNNVSWGGACNTASGGSAGAFYTGPGLGSNNDITGCRAYFCTDYLYTFLGVAGTQLLDPWRATDGGAEGSYVCRYDGFLNHTNNRGGSVSSTSTAAAAVITTGAAHGMFTGEVVNIYGHTGSSTINGNWPITVLSGTTFSIPVQGVAGTATWYSVSNSVTDVQYEDCTVQYFGTRTGNSAPISEALLGGGHGAQASDPTDWKTYPVRYVRCKVINGATNILSNDCAVAFVNCRFEMDRAGQDAIDLSGTYLGGAMGSFSGWNTMGFFGTEVVANLTCSTAAARNLFYLGQTTAPSTASIYAIGSSFYNTGSPTDASGNTQWFVFPPNTASTDGPNRFYARQTMFVHRWCQSTTDTDGPFRGLVNNGRSNFGDVRFGTITATSTAAQAVLTTSTNPHNIGIGDFVTIAFHTGSSTLNGTWQVLATPATNTFTINVQGVAGTATFTDTSTNWNVRDCFYSNITTDKYIPYSGGTKNLGPESSGDNYKENVDPNGVYPGQDPTTAQIATGKGPANPFIDLSGRQLGLNGSAASFTRIVSPAVSAGINGRKYIGNYGAWQYGALQTAGVKGLRNRD